MAVLSRTLLFVFLAAWLCLRVDALKCYSCNTVEDSKCDDPEAEGDKYSVDCSSGISKGQTFKHLLPENATLSKADKFMCFNAKLDAATAAGDVETGIIRGCTILGTETCDFIEENAIKVYYCGTCNTDLCNSAKGLRVTLFTSIVCLFAAFLGAKVH